MKNKNFTKVLLNLIILITFVQIKACFASPSGLNENQKVENSDFEFLLKKSKKRLLCEGTFEIFLGGFLALAGIIEISTIINARSFDRIAEQIMTASQGAIRLTLGSCWIINGGNNYVAVFSNKQCKNPQIVNKILEQQSSLIFLSGTTSIFLNFLKRK